MVGCVVLQGGQVVGRGFHQRYGGPHAEPHALSEAGERARGATAYVSLEPCAHVGKTPPCTEALIAAGVARVVYGAADPGPESGRGHEHLVAAGIEVSGPHFDADRARRENPAFFHHAEVGRPWVTIKLAVSLDGKISERVGATTRLSGPEADEWVQGRRAGFDAILVGGATAHVDDPRLTVRGRQAPYRPPTRIVLDSRATVTATARLLRTPEGGPVVIFGTVDAPLEWQEALEDAGAAVYRVPPGPNGLDLESVMAHLAAANVRSILCEGGGVTARRLVDQGIAQRVDWIVTPHVVGPAGVLALPGPRLDLSELGWRAMEPARSLGQDTLIRLRRDY